MTYIYKLAGENLELAEAELKGFLRSQEIDETPQRAGRIAETDSEPQQLKRLALTHEVVKKIEEIEREQYEIDYEIQDSFAVRAENLTDKEVDTQVIESEIGRTLETEDNSVDLERPDTLIRVYVKEEKLILGKLIEDIPRHLYEKRVNQERPYSSPVSLNPVLARVLVNLSEARPGKNILDPFCGTGGLLIEAGLCGIGVHGLDFQKEMVKGTRKNLEEYGIIAHNIREGRIEDCSEIFDQDFEAIITDLPYGNASKKEGEPIKVFLRILNEYSDSKIVFMYDKKSLDDFEADFEVYVHKNLTRYIFVQ